MSLEIAESHPKHTRDLLSSVAKIPYLTHGFSFGSQKILVLYTSDRLKEVESLVRENRGRLVYIRSTPAGKFLRKCDLFKHLPPDVAYLPWFLLSGNFLLHNKPQRILVVGNSLNKTSTLWNLEIPLLLKTAPSCEIVDYDTGFRLPNRALRSVCQPLISEFVKTDGRRGRLANDFREQGDRLPGRGRLVQALARQLKPFCL